MKASQKDGGQVREAYITEETEERDGFKDERF